jgi:hypothetical protein
MGCCCSIDNIGVYVRNTHWAHALVQQNADLSEAVRRDDDVTLKRLLDVGGGDVDTCDQHGHTLLGIALRQNKPFCRALLESRGAKVDKAYRRRKLPDIPGGGASKSANAGDDAGEDSSVARADGGGGGDSAGEEKRSGAPDPCHPRATSQ